MPDTYASIAAMIDHALLAPTLTEQELEQGCGLAVAYRVASVCILPFFLQRCATLLRGTGVRASTTIGFPHGGHHAAIKLAEARQALDDGGEELDMVVNLNAVRSGAWDYVEAEIRSINTLVHDRGQKLKVIFENCYLDDEQKITLCRLCAHIGVDWVKTSTGFGSGGATQHDLELMRRHAPPPVQVKAAGGIRTLDELLAFRALGVTRVGASRTAEILDEARRRFG